MINKKWQWCWKCDCATINSPDDKENTCCAFWGHEENSTWHDEVFEYLRTNPDRPQAPTQDDVDEWLQRRVYSPWTEEERLICAIFGAYKLDESYYYYIRKWADKEKLNLPTLLELSEQTEEEINYNCKTGHDWNEEEKDNIYIIVPFGWPYDTYMKERIPRHVYLQRRKESECDYTGYISRLKKEYPYPIAIEAEVGQKIHVLAGSCKDQIVTVVKKDFSGHMMKVQKEGAEHPNLICKTTPANIVKI